jgi:hypothetical protein
MSSILLPLAIGTAPVFSLHNAENLAVHVSCSVPDTQRPKVEQAVL